MNITSEIQSSVWKIFLYSKNNSLLTKGSLKLGLIPSFPLCYPFDLLDLNVDITSMRSFILKVYKMKGFSLTLSIEDRNKRVEFRPLKILRQSYTGEILRIADLDDPIYISTIVSFTQTIRSERDVNNPCREYPTALYQDYSQCDQAFVRMLLREQVDDQYEPFWTGRSLYNTTKLRCSK